MGIVSRSGGTGISSVPSARLSRAVAVGGDLTLVNTAGVFAELAAVVGGPGTGGFDLTIAAVSGDVLAVSGSFIYNNVTAVGVLHDVATWVSGAAVNYLGQSAGGGNIGLAFAGSGVAGSAAVFSVQYVVQAGDITGGNVVLRTLYRAGAGRTLSRSVANGPLMLAVANLKQ